MAAARAILSREDLRFPAARFRRTIFGGKHTKRERERERGGGGGEGNARARGGLENFVFVLEDSRHLFLFLPFFVEKRAILLGMSLSLSLSPTLFDVVFNPALVNMHAARVFIMRRYYVLLHRELYSY
jgi:hypothetical protein